MLSSTAGVDLKHTLCTLVLLFLFDDFCRMTSIVITTPMIIKMHAHIKLPTVIGIPFDEETERT